MLLITAQRVKKLGRLLGVQEPELLGGVKVLGYPQSKLLKTIGRKSIFDLVATNQKVGSSTLSGRTIKSIT